MVRVCHEDDAGETADRLGHVPPFIISPISARRPQEIELRRPPNECLANFQNLDGLNPSNPVTEDMQAGAPPQSICTGHWTNIERLELSS